MGQDEEPPPHGSRAGSCGASPHPSFSSSSLEQPAQLSLQSCADEKNFWCHPASESWETLHSKHSRQPHERSTLIFPASPVLRPPSASRLWGYFCLFLLGDAKGEEVGTRKPSKRQSASPRDVHPSLGDEKALWMLDNGVCGCLSLNPLTPSAEQHKIPEISRDKSSHGPQGSAFCPVPCWMS